MRATAALLGLAGIAAAQPAWAQAWVMPRAQGQIIVKYEVMRADDGFDPAGERLPLPAPRTDDVLSLLGEYGLGRGLSVMAKADWQRGRDAFVDYDGRGPIELGLRWQVWRDDRWAVSLQGSVADGGEGRNAGYANPGDGERDWEVRAAAGRNLTVAGHPVFIDLQAARRMRDGLPDETRGDATLGARLDGDWLLLTQVFGGVADDDGPRWLNVETSIVRDLGPWSLQLGWRSAAWGRETPASSGPVVGVWLRF